MDNEEMSHTPNEVDLPDYSPNDDIPEEADEDFNFSQEQLIGTFHPPARIAARFYRPSAGGRRKSSAASSRRNSLSSTHSHASNGSFAAACRSNHAAQYLRRASIIESRKARLAARQAHAEQVRLRAALAKSAPRSSNSGERALAAQHARERHLAQVAAACAEEVRRAKKVAEEMKERRAAEEERYRMELEEKLAEAEKRRLEYKRNMRRPRTASTPPTADVKKPVVKLPRTLDKEASVRCVQRLWRAKRRKASVEAFREIGLGVDKVQNTAFADIQALLVDDGVLTIAAGVLDILSIEDTDDKLDRNATTRRFLTAYLILGHPQQVLGQDGGQEQQMLECAKDIIISFEAALGKAMASNGFLPPPTSLEALHLAASTYFSQFDQWKAKDKTTLIELLVEEFVQLDAIWQTVKGDAEGAVANEYKDAIREQQVVLMARLRRIAGPEHANVLIRKAIKESRRKKQVARRKPVGNVRPRAADVNPIHPNPADPSAAELSSSDATVQLPREEARPQSGIQSRSIQQVFSIMPPNRVLTHELAIDSSYTVDTAPQSKIRDALNRNICNQMREAFELGEGDKWTVAAVDNVRARLLHILPNDKGPMHRLISETLDLEFVQRQCQQGVFSYQAFFTFIADILPKLCAPARDDEVKALSNDLRQYGSLTEMIEKLMRVLQTIDTIQLDYSNFLLQSVAPKLIKEAAGYEQRMFAKELEDGIVTLQRTRRWWNNASVNVLTEADRLDPNHRPTVQKIYARGLVDLAIATASLRDMDIPETLSLDKSRLSHIREQVVRMTVIGTILLSAKNLLKRDVRSQWKSEMNRMWEILKSHANSDVELLNIRVYQALDEANALPEDKKRELQSWLASNSTSPYGSIETLMPKLLGVIEGSHTLPPATKAQLQSTIARLLSQAAAGKITDPVARVLFTRLKQHIFKRLSASSSNERVRAVSMASETLATAGLPEFVTLVGSIVDVLARVGECDRKSHAAWYEQIAAEPEATDDSQELAQRPSSSSSASSQAGGRLVGLVAPSASSKNGSASSK
jgi:hypothetical protein